MSGFGVGLSGSVRIVRWGLEAGLVLGWWVQLLVEWVQLRVEWMQLLQLVVEWVHLSVE